MTTDEMVTELRAMQKQIIHGTKFFGEVADRLEKVAGCMRRVEAATITGSWNQVNSAVKDCELDL